LTTAELAKDIDRAVSPARKGPLDNMIAAKAVGFGEALQPSFKDYAAQIITNCKAFGRRNDSRGLSVLFAAAPENHLIWVDLRDFDAELTGKKAQAVLGPGGHQQ